MNGDNDQTGARPGAKVASGILTDAEITDGVSHDMLIERATFQPLCLGASSYDVRVGAKGILGGQGEEYDLSQDSMTLDPGAYCGVISEERLCLPTDICARIGSKRALSYEGVILLTGSMVDPGYQGHLLFGLYNASQKRVILRRGRKICNIVFERLSRPAEQPAPADPDLVRGDFPDAFVDKMANMEVLAWMEISGRVAQIERITKDILDLKARYSDVLEPIKELTENVRKVTDEVRRLAGETKGIAKDLQAVNKIVDENNRQIGQLTATLGVVGERVQSAHERARALEETDREQIAAVTGLKATFGRFQIIAYIFWGLLMLGAGSGLTLLLSRAFGAQ